MTSLANLKLPVGLVVAIVGQAMGMAVWISSLQADITAARETASVLHSQVSELKAYANAVENRMQDDVQDIDVRLSVLLDQQKQINAEHMQIGDSFRQVWDALEKRGPAPVPVGTQRSYGY